MRVVLDTNQHISAIIRPTGHPAQIVKLWRICSAYAYLDHNFAKLRQVLLLKIDWGQIP